MTRLSHELPFGYEAFSAWYESLRRSALEPARQTFCRILTDEISRVEVEFGPGRFRAPQSRLKDPVRLWAKLHLPKYRNRITALDAISEVIDDLVGVRIVCTNKSDVAKIRRVLDDLVRLPAERSEPDFGVAVEEGSDRDYIREPKDSGYRAYHLNLLTGVPRIGGTTIVKGELQVRTLLQDGWGELTHEDTYKPGQEVPGLVSLLSLRMGELLATVDDIAEDIQGELARISQEAVTDTVSAPETAPVLPVIPTGVSAEIVLAEAARLVSLLDRPTPLAQISTQLRATFGPQVSTDWLGYGTFKNFLLQAVPDIHVVPKGPSYIIPPGAEPDDSWPTSLRPS
ncbi:hypothetical protein [Nocardioides aquiterrae]|uniref:RelA/SpoT domain-containing protein n=1 Tax=Nocardioides aquiterrae TaxID=203799 RepID=A0ABN1UUK0_9ACTN